VIALLPMINPARLDPGVPRHHGRATRTNAAMQQLRMACIYMVAILVSFLIGGTFIMNFFGISIPGSAHRRRPARRRHRLQHADGATARSGGIGRATHAAARAKRDISFSPLAMPMLSGPGAIAVTIGFTSLAGWLDYAAIILGILVVAVISYIRARASPSAS
jgi:multiple antibiotic resistance protein